ncbi:MAG: murein biosynthesis integral membrane protein MurJ [Patescibacteria group bacterium]|nr:murein biosynthesis integral membrane protein MurJ [Patescibacteria group bacterium]MDE1946041.1 murein biosynthesis integral membrane protein MurJ [Patescibacteria group bacterium]
MREKIFGILNRKIEGLHEAAYLLGVFTVLSQILALLRDRVLASAFGVGHTLDVYYAAFEIPDFLLATVGSIVSISVLVPFITHRLEKSEGEAREFISTMFSFFSILIVGCSVVAFFFIPYLAPRVFPGIADKATLIHMARIMLLSPIFLGLSNFVASITQVGKRFLVYALSPLVYNIGIIIGAVFLYPVFGIYGLAYGVILGTIMHLGVQMPFVWKSGLFRAWPLCFDWPVIKKVFLISIPRTITLAMTQITVLALVGMASVMATGSIAVFNFSNNLQNVPLAIIGMSYSLAAFPTLSKFISTNKVEEYLSHMSAALRHTIFWSIPVSVVFIVLRAQIVRVIYGAGKFDWNGTRLVAASLAIFSISVLAQALVLIFIRAYYAKGDTKKSLYASLVTGTLSIGLSYLFARMFAGFDGFRFFIEHLFRVDGLPGTEVLALALGFSIAQIVNCVMLWIWFSREHPGFAAPLYRTLFQSFSASVIMGFVSYLALNFFSVIFNLNKVAGIFMQGFLSGLVGIAACILILKLLKSRELEETIDVLHRKFWRSRPIMPDVNATDLQ